MITELPHQPKKSLLNTLASKLGFTEKRKAKKALLDPSLQNPDSKRNGFKIYPFLPQEIPGIAPNIPMCPLKIDDYGQVIQQNVQSIHSIFGVNALCFSQSLALSFKRAEKISQINSPVLITGESGTGKTMMARAIHHRRRLQTPIELSCKIAPRALRLKINHFLKDRSSSLILKHIDHLDLSDFALLEPLLNQKISGLYFTSTEHFFQKQQEMSSVAALRLVNLPNIHIKPLRDRPEDLIFQLVLEAIRLNQDLEEPYSEITSNFLNKALNCEWLDNSVEIKSAMSRQILNNNAPSFNHFSTNQRGPCSLAYLNAHCYNGTNLSIREFNDKLLIEEILKKNKYNKSKTKDELKITINTLNSKINLYQIQFPKK